MMMELFNGLVNTNKCDGISNTDDFSIYDDKYDILYFQDHFRDTIMNGGDVDKDVVKFLYLRYNEYIASILTQCKYIMTKHYYLHFLSVYDERYKDDVYARERAFDSIRNELLTTINLDGNRTGHVVMKYLINVQDEIWRDAILMLGDTCKDAYNNLIKDLGSEDVIPDNLKIEELELYDFLYSMYYNRLRESAYDPTEGMEGITSTETSEYLPDWLNKLIMEHRERRIDNE